MAAGGGIGLGFGGWWRKAVGDAVFAGVGFERGEADGGAAFVDVWFVLDGADDVLVGGCVESELGAVELFFPFFKGYAVFEIGEFGSVGAALPDCGAHQGQVFLLYAEIGVLDNDPERSTSRRADTVGADPPIGIDDMGDDAQVDRVLGGHEIFEAIHLWGIPPIFLYR